MSLICQASKITLKVLKKLTGTKVEAIRFLEEDQIGLTSS